MSDPKEPGFFSTDALPTHYHSVEEYLDLFTPASPDQTVISDASTSYLHSSVALEKLREFQTNAKLMVMLRCPKDLVYAFHGELLKLDVECERNFETAWELQQARAEGKALPPRCWNAHRLQYKWIGSLGSQVQNLLRIFPKSRVHFALFDDFATDPGHEYHKLLNFLELPHDVRQEFPRINESIRYKWLWLGQFPKRLRGRIARPLATLRRRTGMHHGTGLLKTIDRFNAVPAQRPPLRPEFQRHLTEMFSDEVRLLEELLDQDLSAWREERS